MDSERDDLATVVAELLRTLDELRAELDGPSTTRQSTDRSSTGRQPTDQQSTDRQPTDEPPTSSPSTGSRPTGVSGLLRFTERYAIPAMIAVLEANIRTLELLAEGLRVADGRRDGTRVSGPGPRRGDRTATAALDAIDRTLTDLSEAAAGTPADPEARRLLERARDLRDEAERRVEGRSTGPETASVGDGRTERRTETEARSSPVEIDVEAELDDVRREVDEE